MRLGILGGSFNPPHVGHLLLASDSFDTLGLDRLLIIPAFANPLKEIADGTPLPEQRMEMASLTFGPDPRFAVSSMEIDRGGLSYTVDTLDSLTVAHPGAELILLIGMDAWRTLNHWKAPARIRRLATLAVFSRGLDVVPVGVTAVTTRRIDVSSSEIRHRVANGSTIRGFVTESVERYINDEKLYAGTAPADGIPAMVRGNGNA
ncbi:MAG: nicotinate (nicotinamide) nucleotide adenylyltransferase [Gemmatimonadaceae bacterium]